MTITYENDQRNETKYNMCISSGFWYLFCRLEQFVQASLVPKTHGCSPRYDFIFVSWLEKQNKEKQKTLRIISMEKNSTWMPLFTFTPVDTLY